MPVHDSITDTRRWPGAMPTPAVGMQCVQDDSEDPAGRQNESAQSLPRKRGNGSRLLVS